MKRPDITPGPWRAEDACIWHEQGIGDVVATTSDRADKLGFDPRNLSPQELANAKATAALPDLLDALEGLLTCLDCFESNDHFSSEITAAKTALTKAGYTFGS